MGEVKNHKKQIAFAFLVGLVFSVLSFFFSDIKLIDMWEMRTYDLRMSILQKFRPSPKNVVMFYVDEASLRHMSGQGINWPWPRELYASALDFCKKGGARAVVFDLFFSEDSSYGVEDDAAFATGVKNGPPSYFVLFASKNQSEEDSRTKIVLEKAKINFAPPLPPWLNEENSLQSLPIEPLLPVATGFGNAQIPPDEDGVYRRITLLEKLGDTIIPSMPLKIAHDLKNISNILWKTPTQLFFGDLKIPLDTNGRMMVNYYGGVKTFPDYSLAEILVSDAAISEGKKPALDPSIVKDKIVIVGLAAPGLYDLKAMPLSKVYPGPEVHASAIENILTNDFITPTRFSSAFAITLIFGLVAAVGLSVLKSSWGIGGLLIAETAVLLGTGLLLFRQNIWMPVVAPFAAMSSSAFAVILKNYLTEGRKKRAIRRAFGQYLSPHIVNEIAKNPDSLKLGGALQDVTLFFSDIANFTTLSEKTSPEDLVKMLNEYFSNTTKIIQKHNGTLDKYIGDAIMAFFGAPLVIGDPALQATMSALEIQNFLKTKGSLTTRIGIHTGPALIGNIGSDIRFNYTAMGDAVNLASRLEGLNKKFGTLIIISETTYKLASSSIEARRIGRVRVKGRMEPIGIYEPLGIKGSFNYLSSETFSKFSEGLKLFDSAEFSNAIKLFDAVLKEVNDPVSLYYKKMCDEYITTPPTEFDGVITFTSK